MMVWLLTMESYGEVTVYSEDTDVLNLPAIKDRLEYFSDEPEMVEEFTDELAAVKENGAGRAELVDVFTLELVPVN